MRQPIVKDLRSKTKAKDLTSKAKAKAMALRTSSLVTGSRVANAAGGVNYYTYVAP